MLVAGKFAWGPHVKLPVKFPWYSGKFTCASRQFACILREVLAASTQVNLPVFTGKLHVTQVNCVWDLFTCELHVKLHAFAGNFARGSFTALFSIFSATSSQIFYTGNITAAEEIAPSLMLSTQPIHSKRAFTLISWKPIMASAENLKHYSFKLSCEI